ALLKYGSGAWSDRSRARKPWVVAGYSLSSLVRPLFALVTSPWLAVLVRTGDRIGKGLRSAPRDALLADAVDGTQRGAAYGLQRAMDHAGALGGALLGSALVGLGWDLRAVFALALLPGLVAVLVLVFGVREVQRTEAGVGAARAADPAGALRRLGPFLLVVAFGSLSASVDLFLLVRASELGVPPALLPLLWAVLHAVRAGLAHPLGALSDRVGRRAVIGIGLGVHALVLLGFAATEESVWLWPLFAAHGLHAAFTEGAERGYVADLTGAHKRGAVFGVYHAVQGIAGLAGPLAIGALWDAHGAGPALGAAAAASALALVVLAAAVPRGVRR
ncbi:MAG: MFS transporter, partial [Planctomycetes bacterium]|nr:MFS transporter [Planctomycetota bacterium]